MATDTQPQIRTRPAELRDAEILHKIINAAYRSDKCWTNESKLVRDERVTLDGLRDMIEAGRDPILVALSDEEVIGCIQAECNAFLEFIDSLFIG